MLKLLYAILLLLKRFFRAIGTLKPTFKSFSYLPECVVRRIPFTGFPSDVYTRYAWALMKNVLSVAIRSVVVLLDLSGFTLGRRTREDER